MKPLRIFLIALLLLPVVANAQEGGTTIQGRSTEEQETVRAVDTGPLLDFREEIRKFLENITKYARSQKRNFIVIPKGAPELLTKLDDTDETKSSPARSYMESIDAVMIDGLNFGAKTLGVPTPPEKLDKLMSLARLAKKNRLNVMVLDHVSDATQAEQSYIQNEANGFTPFAANAMGEEMNSIPDFLKAPINENPKNILSLKDVKNFLYLGDTSGYGRQDEFALKMHSTNYDMIIVDVFHGREPLTRQAVETLKYKKIGAKRLVLAYMDIGAAASYKYYWKENWREGSPSWIREPFRDNPDKYRVQYWRKPWQNIIFGDTNSYVYGLIAQGFDGVVIEGLDAYKFFIGNLEDEEEDQ
ncbi:MAG: hypothetical protein HOL37_04150 [Rhodospirillaceae bacterium]|nr:hypothetical protein [Rhodospirillaceae bacterium]